MMLEPAMKDLLEKVPSRYLIYLYLEVRTILCAGNLQ